MDNSYYRVMGLDYGDVRIGVAMSDLTRLISSGLESYTRVNLAKDLEHFDKIIKENKVQVVVLGLPLNMDGTEGVRVEKTRFFADKLAEKSGVKIEYFDERLSSVNAEEILISAGVRRDKRKGVIDKLSATLILQSYLDLKRGELK